MRGADDEPHWMVLKFGRAWERRDIEGVLSVLDRALEYQESRCIAPFAPCAIGVTENPQ